MTLERAIKINTINNDHNPDYTDAERRQAHQLGIEALEAMRNARSLVSRKAYRLLPSETEESEENQS